MVPARLPEDPEITQLRAQLAAQRQRKSGALVKHKRTTSQAVEGILRPTVVMEPVEAADVVPDEDAAVDEDQNGAASDVE